MCNFLPTHIYIDATVADFPLTHRALSYFKGIPYEVIQNIQPLKQAFPLNLAKKMLLITRAQGQLVRVCQGMGDYICCNYLTVSLVSNCHFECSYCILQDYLKNNPLLTFYANVDEILSSVETFLKNNPQHTYRLGTGELSDSLALDPITQFSKELIPFAARQKNMILELKTKSNQVAQLLDLDHQKKTVISWSINPQHYIDQEEFKSASLTERLDAARRVAGHGYPIGFHLDPLLAFSDWEKEYSDLIQYLKTSFHPKEIAWFSLGSLRYTPGLKAIINERFPKSRLLLGELFPSSDGKIRYFREIREMLYTYVKNLINKAFPNVPDYLCMETPAIWKDVYGLKMEAGSLKLDAGSWKNSNF